MGASTGSLLHSSTSIGVSLSSGSDHNLNTNTSPRHKTGTTRSRRSSVRRTLENTSVIFIAYNRNNNANANTDPVITHTTRRRNTLAVTIIAHPFDFRNPRHSTSTRCNVSGLHGRISTLVIVPGSHLLRLSSHSVNVVRTFGATSATLLTNIRNVASLVSVGSCVRISFGSIGSVLHNTNATLFNVNSTQKRSHTARTTRVTVDSPLLRRDVRNTRNTLVGVTNPASLGLRRTSTTARLIHGTVRPRTRVV